MARIRELNLEFVKSVPEKPAPGTLYVSMEYASVVHLCCCGCGNEIVTPLSPRDWKLAYNGESISLHPSIGNWSFPCRSHYWIRGNQVKWADDMTDEEIWEGRNRDRQNRTRIETHTEENPLPAEINNPPKKFRFWKNLRRFFD